LEATGFEKMKQALITWLIVQIDCRLHPGTLQTGPMVASWAAL
jgi:hypothetical protein